MTQIVFLIKKELKKTLANLTSEYHKISIEKKEEAISEIENFVQKILCDLGINKTKTVIALHNNDEDDFIYVTCKEDFDYLV